MKLCSYRGIVAICLFFGCANQVAKKPVARMQSPLNRQTHESISAITTQKKDTLIYIVDFKDSLLRQQFTMGLDKLIKKFPPQPTIDSENHSVKIQIVKHEPGAASLEAPLASGITEKPVALAAAIQNAPAPIPPVFGGMVKLYTQRSFIDDNIARMLSAAPFDKKSCSGADTSESAGYLSVKNTADKGVMLSLAASIQGGDGRILSAFDIVTGWSDLAKKRPGEAVSLFRYATGIQQFLSGREGVITGFQIVDDKTVVIQFSQADPSGLSRLCTPRLFPAAFAVGPYFVKTEKNNVLTLAPNAHYPLGRPYLNACEIKMGGDPNPYLSFSMRRYDAMTVFTLKDIDYARHLQADQSNLTGLAEDRYFLSLAMPSADIRQFIRRMIDVKDMLGNYVTAEGAPIKYVETDAPIGDASSPTNKNVLSVAPSSSAPVSILFRKDDPASRLIAEKLLADLAPSGLSCALKGCWSEEYERGLIRRDYGIAVGWAPAGVLNDQSERLRLSALWFNDVNKEQQRIDEAKELPLFTVKTYLLTNKKIVVPESGLAGMFVR